MARRLNPEAEVAGNWTSIAGAIEGVLRFLGIDLTQPALMSLSGHAFRFAIAQSGAGVAAPESPFLFDYERALPLYGGLGLTWETEGAWPDDPDYERRRERLVARIRRSIDRGKPCVVYGLQLTEFGIVNGYDERAGLFYISTSISSQYGTSLPLAQWPAPGHVPLLRGLFPDRSVRVERSAAERSALRFAVAYASGGDPGGPAGVAHGIAAYEVWLEAYDRGLPIDPAGNRRCIQTLQAARRDAATFLNSLAERMPAERERLIAVARDYELEALALSRMATLFPYPGGGDTENRGLRHAAAAALRQSLALERAAILALEQIVASLSLG
jgi:hypothetical protein